MPEFDAFGRRVDEDTLADQGWRSSSEQPAEERRTRRSSVELHDDEPRAWRSSFEPSAGEPRTGRSSLEPPGDEPRAEPAVLEPRPASSTPAASPAPPAGAPRRAARRRSRRLGLRLLPHLIVATVLVALGGSGFGLFNAAQDRVNEATDSLKQLNRDLETPVVPPTLGSATTKPGPSLVTPRGFRRGLRILRRDAPGRLRQLRVEPGRIDAQVVRAGRLRFTQFQRNADAAQVLNAVPANPGKSMTYAQLDPRTPARLITSGAKRLGVRPARVSYLVAMRDIINGDVEWLAYWPNGSHVIGDARGRITRAIRA